MRTQTKTTSDGDATLVADNAKRCADRQAKTETAMRIEEQRNTARSINAQVAQLQTRLTGRKFSEPPGLSIGDLHQLCNELHVLGLSAQATKVRHAANILAALIASQNRYSEVIAILHQIEDKMQPGHQRILLRDAIAKAEGSAQ